MTTKQQSWRVELASERDCSFKISGTFAFLVKVSALRKVVINFENLKIGCKIVKLYCTTIATPSVQLWLEAFQNNSNLHG